MKPTIEQLNDPKWWDERAGSASHYCPVNGQFYDARLHPCCIPRPTQWRGMQDGNPPPGTECKIAMNATKFVDVRITTYTDKSVVIEHLDTGREECISREAKWEFRPIGSERDKAVEQMQRDLKFVADPPNKELLGKLYDKGWRKLVSRAEAEDRIKLNPSYTATEILNAIGYKE